MILCLGESRLVEEEIPPFKSLDVNISSTESKIEKLTIQLELECKVVNETIRCSGELPRVVKQGRRYFYVTVDPAVEYSEVYPDVAKYIEKLEEKNAKLRRELEELKRKLAEIEAKLTGQSEHKAEQKSGKK